MQPRIRERNGVRYVMAQIDEPVMVFVGGDASEQARIKPGEWHRVGSAAEKAAPWAFGTGGEESGVPDVLPPDDGEDVEQATAAPGERREVRRSR